MATVIEAPPVTGGNVPTRNAEGIKRHARKEHVRTAFMIHEVGAWKASRRRAERGDCDNRVVSPAREILFQRPDREIVKHKRRVRHARVIG